MFSKLCSKRDLPQRQSAERRVLGCKSGAVCSAFRIAAWYRRSFWQHQV